MSKKIVQLNEEVIKGQLTKYCADTKYSKKEEVGFLLFSEGTDC